MRVREMASAEGQELNDLFSALGVDRKAIAEICGKSIHAPNRWRAAKKIPKVHLMNLGVQLAKKFEGVPAKDLSPNVSRAIAYLERELKTPIAVLAATGSTSPNNNSALASAIGLSPRGSRIGMDLKNLSLEDLISEIDRRGWHASLTLKAKK